MRGLSWRSGLQARLRSPDLYVPVTVLVLTAAVRVGFWSGTGLTLEDALISARYAHNIALGNGFTYNPGEWVLGTTTPLWTLILAALELVGFHDPLYAAKGLGILLDCISLLLLLSLLPKRCYASRLLFGMLFAASPTIVPITVSSMETPLLTFSMALTLAGLTQKRFLFAVGLALTVLTRIDGLLFVLVIATAAMLSDTRWAARQVTVAVLLCAPWFAYAVLTFGSVLPQSVLAKSSAYHLGAERSAAGMLGPFLPIGEHDPVRIAVKSLLAVSGFIGIGVVAVRLRRFLPLVLFFLLYVAAFSLSGGLIFAWYVVPPVVILYVILALATSAVLSLPSVSRRPVRGFLVGFLLTASIVHHGGLLHSRYLKYAELQQCEDALRRPLGLWLHEHTPPGTTIFLEPIGYIGYYAGVDRTIIDEIGLVAPEVTALRRGGPGWYVRALRTLQPDYVVQYRAALEENESEGTGAPLFNDDEEAGFFHCRYAALKEFDVTDRFAGIPGREKAYCIFVRRDP